MYLCISEAILWHWSDSSLAQVIVCYLAAPGHNLQQFYRVISEDQSY